MSADGTIVAVGAPQDVGTDSGHVRVHKWNGTGWVQRGGDIDGEAAEDRSGYSVALSADGSTLIVGAPSTNDAAVGYARTYVY